MAVSAASTDINKSLEHLVNYLTPSTLALPGPASVRFNLEKLVHLWTRTTLSNLQHVQDKFSFVDQQLSQIQLNRNQTLSQGFESFLKTMKEANFEENESVDPDLIHIYAKFASETLSRLEVTSDLETVFFPQISLTAASGTWTYTNNFRVKTKVREDDFPVNMIQYNHENSFGAICQSVNKSLCWSFADLFLAYIQIIQANQTFSESVKSSFQKVRDQMRSVVGQSSKDLFENTMHDKIVDFIKENIENNKIEAEDNVYDDDNQSCILNFTLGSRNYLQISFNVTDPLNIAVLGSSGVGKSSFVNGILELHEDDEGAAQVDIMECTDKVGMYTNADYKGVVFWDLPGAGTTAFPAETYLSRPDIRFSIYDAYFILFSDRCSELDGWLANNIQRRNKPVCFVRTKVAESLRANKRKKDFDEENCLDKIRKYCVTELKRVNVRCQEDQLFLVDNWEVDRYDFPKFKKALKGILGGQATENYVKAHTKLKNMETELKPLLEETADYLDKLRKDCDYARVSGTSLNVVGGVLSIVGGALTLATAGAAAPVLITGISLSASGGVIGFGNAIAKGKLSSDSVARCQARLTEHKRMVCHVQRCLSQLKMFSYRETLGDEMGAKLGGQTGHGYDVATHLSTVGITAPGVSLGLRGMQLAEGGLEVGAKVAARATIIVSSLFLVWDTVNLGRGIRDIVQNKECQISQKLRDMAKGIDVNNLNSENNTSATDQSDGSGGAHGEVSGILRVLECPVCLCEMIPPTKIYQCTNGHGVCCVCKEAMGRARRTTCPTCNAAIMGRAHAMEQVARSLYGID